ncbi:Bug family tripartite tricarboxylate transporter substrate binding protein [Variovorax sp. RA8]|uniref:Bug family tripartite tricarboxylate transporter substrate binding protein n=1 Tax=Variovorax sp. (strain JCM 16519 / RA8) TaxID=662548 RepID=UPI001E28B189|nr:tripartite tricarboxylate transporter substrate binding protein [Variovorax sp. RA8]
MIEARTTRRNICRMAAALSLAALSPHGHAAGAWPTKTITLVVPFAAGGTTDIVGRTLGQALSELWGQPVVIDNRAGAGGNIGTALASKAPADGHTLLLISGSVFTVNPHLYRKVPFDVHKDFVPITNVASTPMVVVVPANSDARDLKALIHRAKEKPGVVNFGSAGPGSQLHMAGEGFASAAGVELVHVPYKGEAPAFADLMAGQTQLVVGMIGAAASLVNDGRLRALAVTSRERSPLLPNVPTTAESGLPSFVNNGWFGLAAPAGTPGEVVAKIQRDTATVLERPALQHKLRALGMVPVGNSSAAFAKSIDEESARWAALIKSRKLAIE